MRFCTLFSIAVMGGGLMGCGGPTLDPVQINTSIILIEHPNGDAVRFTGGAGQVQISETLAVKVKDNRLIVNDKDYGPCNPGDKVKIDAGMNVKVNDEVRQPGRAP